MREVDLLLLFVPFVHGEVDNPAEIETVFRNESKFGTDLITRGPRELDEIARLSGNAEHRFSIVEPELRTHRSRSFRPDVLRHRPGAALLALTPEDISQTRLAFRLRPFVHAVAERTIAALRRRDSPNLDLRISRDHV